MSETFLSCNGCKATLQRIDRNEWIATGDHERELDARFCMVEERSDGTVEGLWDHLPLDAWGATALLERLERIASNFDSVGGMSKPDEMVFLDDQLVNIIMAAYALRKKLPGNEHL